MRAGAALMLCLIAVAAPVPALAAEATPMAGAPEAGRPIPATVERLAALNRVLRSKAMDFERLSKAQKAMATALREEATGLSWRGRDDRLNAGICASLFGERACGGLTGTFRPSGEAAGGRR